MKPKEKAKELFDKYYTYFRIVSLTKTRKTYKDVH